MTDERIRRTPAGASREDRAMEDRAVTQDREFNEADRFAMLRASLHEDQLPRLPEIPGWHFCWVSTLNARDNPQTRIMKGWELVKASDLKGYQVSTVKSGELQGAVSVNEMILMKIPQEVHDADMRFFHKIRPAEEEARLQAPLDAIRQAAKEKNLRIAEGEEADNWR